MPFFERPFGWVWLLLIGWTAYRLVSAVVLGVRDASQLGRRPVRSLSLTHGLASAVVGAVVFAVGWRAFFPHAGPVNVICGGLVLGSFGLVAGLKLDLSIALQLQLRLALALVLRRAPYYAELLSIGDQDQRIMAARALAFIGIHANFATPELLKAFRDSDPELRYESARALVCVEEDDAAVVEAARQGLNDPDIRVRALSACSLVKRGHGAASGVIEALIEGIKLEPNEPARDFSIAYLHQLGPAAAPAIPYLIGLIGDSFQETFHAHYLLTAIGAPAVPALIEQLYSPDKQVRDAVIDTLGAIGPAAADALPRFNELRAAADANTRRAIDQAIEKIRPGNQPA